MYAVLAGALVLFITFLSGVRIVRPTSRGLVERLGKYPRLAMPGFNWLIRAEGEAQSIQLVNEAAGKFFVGNAQLMRVVAADVPVRPYRGDNGH